jgi:hypothetical protein
VIAVNFGAILEGIGLVGIGGRDNVVMAIFCMLGSGLGGFAGEFIITLVLTGIGW